MPEAVEMYRSDGGSLSEPTLFGVDPLASDLRKQNIREQSFLKSYSFENLFYKVSNGHGEPFQQALKYYINITRRLFLSS